jgi:hypothetical protein
MPTPAWNKPQVIQSERRRPLIRLVKEEDLTINTGIIYLFYDAVNSSDYIASNANE